MFDLSGRIVLQDAFSAPLRSLTQQAQAAQSALGNMGAAGDQGAEQVAARAQATARAADALRGAGGVKLPTVDPATASNLERVAGGVQMVSNQVGASLGPLGAFAAMLGPAGIIATGLAAVGIAMLKTVDYFGQMGAESAQVEARFVAFSGSASTAANNFNTLDAAIGNAMSRDEKMAAISRIMSLNLASNATELANLVQQALLLGPPMASAEQKVDSLTQILVTGRTMGLAQYGISVKEVNDRVKELTAQTAGLTDADAKQLAIKEALAQKAAQVEQAGGLPATAYQEADKARADLLDTIGDLAKASGEAMARNRRDTAISLTKFVQALAGPTQNEQALTQSRLQLAAADAQLADAEWNLARAKEGGVAADIEAQQATVASAQTTRNAWAAVAQANDVEAQLAATRAKVAAGVFEQATNTGFLANAVAAYGKEQKQANEALDAFQAAGGRSTASAAAYQDVVSKLGAAVKQFAELSSTTVVAPQMPQTLLAFDPAPWNAYIAALREVGGAATTEAANQTQAWVDKLAGERDAVLASALALADHRAGLQLLATSYGGAGTGIDSLVANFQKLPPDVQAAIQALGGFDAVLSTIRANAAQPITLDVQIKGLQDTLGQIDSMALRLAGVMSESQIRQFRDKARADVAGHWSEMGKLDRFGVDLEKATILKGYEDIVSNTTQFYKQTEAATASHYTNLASSAQGLRSMIESALKSGLAVTPEQMAAAKAGTYQDVALENARRAQAVMERGFAEIKAHPDWATALKIPPEVLAGSEAGLKAWAGRLQSSITNLERPDLINWDAFLKQFEDAQNAKAAQELTIDVAVGKLDAAGLLKGKSDVERRKEVAKALGFTAPEITIDTLFAPKGSGSDLVTQFLRGKQNVEIPAKLVIQQTPEELLKQGPPQPVPVPVTPSPTVALTPEQLLRQGPAQPTAITPPLPQALTPEQLLRQGPPQPLPTPPVAADMTAQGALAAAGYSSGWLKGISEQNLAMGTGNALLADFTKNQSGFAAVGKGMGNVFGVAFGDAVKESVGGVRHDLAVLIAPEVADILSRKSGTASKP